MVEITASPARWQAPQPRAEPEEQPERPGRARLCSGAPGAPGNMGISMGFQMI